MQYLLDDESWRLFELTCGETKFRPVPKINATSANVAMVKDDGLKSQPPARPNMKPYTVNRMRF